MDGFFGVATQTIPFGCAEGQSVVSTRFTSLILAVTSGDPKAVSMVVTLDHRTGGIQWARVVMPKKENSPLRASYGQPIERQREAWSPHQQQRTAHSHAVKVAVMHSLLPEGRVQALISQPTSAA